MFAIRTVSSRWTHRSPHRRRHSGSREWERKALKREPSTVNWTRSGSLALLETRAMVISGDRIPRASGQTGRGPGSQRGSLVRRGQRATATVRRDDSSWLIGDSPSGAEASSGPPDTCRSTGRGVEEATGIPPAGTPGNRGRPHSYSSSDRHRRATRPLERRPIIERDTPPRAVAPVWQPLTT